MKRIACALIALSTVGTVGACTDDAETLYDGEQIKSDDGKADSSALATFDTVAKLGLPSGDRALYNPALVIPADLASSVIFRARAMSPRAAAMSAGSPSS